MTLMKKSFTALLLLGLSLNAFAEPTKSASPKLTLTNCHLDGIKAQVQCGSLKVPENYGLPAGEGAQLSINFAVLPAIDNSDNKTPLMFLAGGPGQAGVELAPMLKNAFKEVGKTRDIILVDQRGTGKSHPLECPDILDHDIYKTLPKDSTEQEVKDCIAQFKGDLSQFNSENAIRDFDAVRAALGHKQINLYGGSYGTRAGLVYMRMFPQSIRAIVLDSVGPIEVPIGLFGQSAARSFKLLLEHCQQDEACQNAYPNLALEFQNLLSRLDFTPVKVTIPHPRLGTKTTLMVDRSKFISYMRMQLYSVSGRALVPLMIHQAYHGNFLPLAGLIANTEGSTNIYVGLLYNITCNEDFPKITEQMFTQDAKNTFGRDNSHSGFKLACPIWPKYTPSKAFYQAVTANVPTLILSGDLDPVTPPSNGEYPAKTLSNSHHIVVKNTSHGVALSTCASDIVNEFLTSLDPKKLDESCLKDVPKETFMGSLNGGTTL